MESSFVRHILAVFILALSCIETAQLLGVEPDAVPVNETDMANTLEEILQAPVPRQISSPVPPAVISEQPAPETIAQIPEPIPSAVFTPVPSPVLTPAPIATPSLTPSPPPTLTPTPTPCTTDWQCSQWGSCINDAQNRTCTDANACEPQKTEVQDCVSLNHIIFSEVLYDTPGEENDEEWLKLYNPSGSRIEMPNWSISDNSGSWKFSVSVESKAFITVARDGEGFRNITGCVADMDKFSRRLNNDGDFLLLKDGEGREVDFVAWEGGGTYAAWNITAPEGKTIKRTPLSADTDTVSDWIVSDMARC